MEKNIKLYPIYVMFSYDILFYYSIKMLFFTGIKGFTVSQVAFMTTAYCLSYVFLQIPANIITDKIGTKRALIFGNSLNIIWTIAIMTVKNYPMLLLSEVISALAFTLKGSATTPFIVRTLNLSNKSNKFSIVEGRGSFLYFVTEAIASVLAGILYSINAYLPLIFSLAASTIATVISIMFKSPDKQNNSTQNSDDFKSFIGCFKFIIKSSRLHALLLYSAAFAGILVVVSVMSNAFFIEHELSSTGFGIAFAIFSIMSGAGSILQDKIEKRYRNKTLMFISLTCVLCLLVCGLTGILLTNSTIIIIMGILLFSIQYLFKGAYRIIIKEYLSRYNSNEMRTKIMSSFYLCENLGNALFSAIASLAMALWSASLTLVFFGIAFAIIEIFIIFFMDSRVGLDPSSYTKKDRSDLI